MQNSQIVEIDGIIRKDLVIMKSRYGMKYGAILVEKKNDTPNRIMPYKPFWFYAFIWDTKLLKECSLHLKIGRQILVKGDPEVMGNSKNLDYELNNMTWYTTLIVNVRRAEDLLILEDNNQPSS